MSHLIYIAASAFAGTVAACLYATQNTSKFRSASWNDLVMQLQPLDARAIQVLANDHLHPMKGQLQIEPYEMWEMIGGVEGLAKMRHNADVICALAAYAERWNFNEAVIVTERIRLEAHVVRRAVSRASRYGTMDPLNNARAPFCVFEAATAYHLMRARLFALYESSHQGLYPRLARAL